MVLIDDFEDGDTDADGYNGWNAGLSGGSFTTSTSSPLQGNHSAIIDSGLDSEHRVDVSGIGDDKSTYSFDVEVLETASSGIDRVEFIPKDSAVEELCDIAFTGTGDISVRYGDNQLGDLGTFNIDEVFSFELIPDFSNNEFDVIINGTNEGTFGFLEDFSGLDRVELTAASDWNNDDTRFRAKFDSIETTLLPAPSNTAASLNTDGDPVVTWDTNGSPDGHEVYRSESAGVNTSGSPLASVGGSTESYTDTDRPDGQALYYRVVAIYDNGRSDDSNEATTTTPLPAPTDLLLTDVRFSEVDLSYTSNQKNGEIRIDVDVDNDGGWVEFTTISHTNEMPTVSGLLNGQYYGLRVVAQTDDKASIGPNIEFTTNLSDEDQPVLGNGVEDEVAIDRQTETTNNGSVRIQIRETGQSTWDSTATGFGEFVGAFDTVQTEFVGREDGEEYEVRARTETEYVTGAWTEPVAITTQFPGATALTATAISETEVELEWTDNADNEDGQLVVREKRFPDGSFPGEREIADAGPNTESFTDDTAQPDTEYRYRVRPYTEHTSAESNTDTATTDDIGLPRTRVPASGWHVEIDHPSGTTLTPAVLADDTEQLPRLKAMPRVRIAVPKSDRWEDGVLEGEPIRVWKDGTQLPIEQIRSIERETDEDVIEAAGGVALENDIEGFQIAEADADDAARQVITKELGWAANVDDPTAEPREDVRLSQTDFRLDEELVTTFDEYDPIEFFNSVARTTRTASFTEAEDADGSGATFFADTEGNDGAWSGNETIQLDPGDSRTFELPVDHTIPAGELVAEFVFSIPTAPTPGFDVTLETAGGTTEVLSSIPQDTFGTTNDQFDMRSRVEQATSSVGDLQPGTHEVTIEVTGGEPMYLDFAHLRDDRFPYDTSQLSATNDVVEGWEQFPDAVDLEFETLQSVEQIVAATVDIEMTEAGGPVALGLRADNTDPYDEVTNATSHTFAPASPSQTIQARVTLGRSDTGSASGQYGAAPHELDLIEVDADLINTPVVLDLVHEGTIKRLLNTIADAGDSVWEVRPHDGPEPYRIEWTQPGQRVADREPALVDYSGRRTIEGSYQRVIAQGKSASVEAETFTSNDQFDLLTGLDEQPIDTGTEVVYDVGDRSTQYQRNIDYRMDYRKGAIAVLEGGQMSTDTEYQIDYEWRYEGRYTDPGYDGEGQPRTLRESFPDAASDRECEQLALAVVREVAAPREEATVTVREPTPDRPLVEAINPEELPFEGPLRVRSVTNSARSVQLKVGSRRDAGDVVEDLNDRLAAVARNI